MRSRARARKSAYAETHGRWFILLSKSRRTQGPHPDCREETCGTGIRPPLLPALANSLVLAIRYRPRLILHGPRKGAPIVRHRLGQFKELGRQVLRAGEFNPQLARLQRYITREITHAPCVYLSRGRNADPPLLSAAFGEFANLSDPRPA